MKVMLLNIYVDQTFKCFLKHSLHLRKKHFLGISLVILFFHSLGNTSDLQDLQTGGSSSFSDTAEANQ